jgi:hypothetical protein
MQEAHYLYVLRQLLEGSDLEYVLQGRGNARHEKKKKDERKNRVIENDEQKLTLGNHRWGTSSADPEPA